MLIVNQLRLPRPPPLTELGYRTSKGSISGSVSTMCQRWCFRILFRISLDKPFAKPRVFVAIVERVQPLVNQAIS